jgi:hypothetical protein
VFGTHWVQFQPIQVKGEIQGCQLVFLTVIADHAYLHGNQVAVNGSIVLREIDTDLALVLKVGLKDITSLSTFERPAFAYLQTATASTAKAKQKSLDGDPGYRLFMYPITDTDTMAVLNELMTSAKVSIGYNRRSDGFDVLAPLDLMVTDSKYPEDQKVLRTRSPQVLNDFAECSMKVIEHVADKLK